MLGCNYCLLCYQLFYNYKIAGGLVWQCIKKNVVVL